MRSFGPCALQLTHPGCDLISARLFRRFPNKARLLPVHSLPELTIVFPSGLDCARALKCSAPPDRIKYLLVLSILQPAFGALAQDHGRTKRKPTDAVGAARLISDMVIRQYPRERRHRRYRPWLLPVSRTGPGRHRKRFCAGPQSVVVEQKVNEYSGLVARRP